MSFNRDMYGSTVRKWIPDISEDDLTFVCNKSSDVYKSVESAGCVDNYRVSRVIADMVSDDYQEAIDNGCCGFSDVTFTNHKTGHLFRIGFNFGH